MTSLHSDLAGVQLHEAFHYVDAADPGAVGAGKYWLDISGDPYILNRRDPTDAFWTQISGGGGAVTRAWAYQRQTDQTIPTATNTAVEFSAAFLIDDGGWFSIGDPTRFTTPSDGFSAGNYLVGATVRFFGNNTGIRQVYLQKNGTDVFALSQLPPGTDDLIMNCVGMVVLTATDYVELFVEQESGGDLDIIMAGLYSPTIWGHKVN